MDRKSAASLLGRVPLFRGLDSRELERMLERAAWRELPNGATLIRQGEDP